LFGEFGERCFVGFGDLFVLELYGDGCFVVGVFVVVFVVG